MRLATRTRLTWSTIGFFSGWISCSAFLALQLWPFEDKAFLKWTRWMGKESIKWTFIAMLIAIVIFAAVQILNVLWFARDISDKRKK